MIKSIFILILIITILLGQVLATDYCSSLDNKFKYNFEKYKEYTYKINHTYWPAWWSNVSFWLLFWIASFFIPWWAELWFLMRWIWYWLDYYNNNKNSKDYDELKKEYEKKIAYYNKQQVYHFLQAKKDMITLLKKCPKYAETHYHKLYSQFIASKKRNCSKKYRGTYYDPEVDPEHCICPIWDPLWRNPKTQYCTLYYPKFYYINDNLKNKIINVLDINYNENPKKLRFELEKIIYSLIRKIEKVKTKTKYDSKYEYSLPLEKRILISELIILLWTYYINHYWPDEFAQWYKYEYRVWLIDYPWRDHYWDKYSFIEPVIYINYYLNKLHTSLWWFLNKCIKSRNFCVALIKNDTRYKLYAITRDFLFSNKHKHYTTLDVIFRPKTKK